MTPTKANQIKVKEFLENDQTKLAKSVRAFLAGQPEATILDIQYSSLFDHRAFMKPEYTALIIYTENQ